MLVNGSPLQYSCLENPYGQSLAGYSPWGRKSQTRLSNYNHHHWSHHCSLQSGKHRVLGATLIKFRAESSQRSSYSSVEWPELSKVGGRKPAGRRWRQNGFFSRKTCPDWGFLTGCWFVFPKRRWVLSTAPAKGQASSSSTPLQPSGAGVQLGSSGHRQPCSPLLCSWRASLFSILEEPGLCLNLELERIHSFRLNVFVLFVFFYSIRTEGSNQHHLQMPK